MEEKGARSSRAGCITWVAAHEPVRTALMTFPEVLKLSRIALDITPTLAMSAPQIKLSTTAYSMDVAPSSSRRNMKNRLGIRMMIESWGGRMIAVAR